MTKEQAIQLIKSDGVYSKEVIEALEDAEGDCINRQAVIDLINKHNVSYGDIFITDKKKFIKCLYELPSASSTQNCVGNALEMR